jgi:hypothetical protein
MLPAVVAGLGFPLSQAAVSVGGRPAAMAVEAVAVACTADALARLATTRDALLRPMLAGEVAAAALSAVTGAALLRDPEVRLARTGGWHVGAGEIARRAALGTMFGLRSWRLGGAAIEQRG